LEHQYERSAPELSDAGGRTSRRLGFVIRFHRLQDSDTLRALAARIAPKLECDLRARLGPASAIQYARPAKEHRTIPVVSVDEAEESFRVPITPPESGALSEFAESREVIQLSEYSPSDLSRDFPGSD
jgi:hypothetical protein